MWGWSQPLPKKAGMILQRCSPPPPWPEIYGQSRSRRLRSPGFTDWAPFWAKEKRRFSLGCEDVSLSMEKTTIISNYYVEHIWKSWGWKFGNWLYFLKSSHGCFLHVFFLYAYSFIGDVTLVFLGNPARFGRNFWLKSWIDGRSAVWCPKKLVCLLGTCEKPWPEEFSCGATMGSQI